MDLEVWQNNENKKDPFIQQALEFQKSIEAKEPEKYWLKLIVIDPGFVNNASIFLQYAVSEETNQIFIQLFKRRCLVDSLVDDRKALDPECSVIPYRNWALRNFSEEDFRPGGQVLMEKQYIFPFFKTSAQKAKKNGKGFQKPPIKMTMKLQVIQTLIYSLFASIYQVEPIMITSSAVKNGLKIATKEHDKNKQEVVDWVKRTLEGVTPEDKTALNELAENNHIADCLAMAYYYLKKNIEQVYWETNQKYKNFNVVFQIVE
jgi:hypothetical protein